jgi:hypothetical protein
MSCSNPTRHPSLEQKACLLFQAMQLHDTEASAWIRFKHSLLRAASRP